MDGGFSAKRTANAGLVDQQKFHSTYLLSREYVNLFKDEVKKRKPPEVVVGEEVSALLLTHGFDANSKFNR